MFGIRNLKRDVEYLKERNKMLHLEVWKLKHPFNLKIGENVKISADWEGGISFKGIYRGIATHPSVNNLHRILYIEINGKIETIDQYYVKCRTEK
jgi:hypothetical protein